MTEFPSKPNTGEFNPFCDDDWYDREDWQERVNTIRDEVDEISLNLHTLLSERENTNLRKAYGTIQRCLAYLDEEL